MDASFDSLLTFGDGNGAPTIETLLLRLLAAFVLGQAVAWVYCATHRGVSYTTSTPQALVILALIVTLVMTVIGSNIARAFGLFGALALIRFRTPVKDVRDTVYLFLSVTIGIAAGTGNVLAATVGTILIGAAIYHIAAVRFGGKVGHDGLLRFQAPPGDEAQVHAVLERHCDEVKLLEARDAGPDSVEYSLEIALGDPAEGPALLADVRGLPGVTGISLLMQDLEVIP